MALSTFDTRSDIDVKAVAGVPVTVIVGPYTIDKHEIIGGGELVKDGAGYRINGQTSGALGVGAVNLGSSTSTAAGYNSFVVGTNNTASRGYATAIGNHSVASGWYSTAIGWGCEATSQYSTAIGKHNVATKPGSTAIGINSHANGNSSFAVGNTAYAEGAHSFATGSNSTAQNHYQTSLGTYNVGTATDSILEIGHGRNGANKNVFEVFTDSTATLPHSTIDLINARGEKAIATKEYVDGASGGGGGGLGLEPVRSNDNNIKAWRLIGRDPLTHPDRAGRNSIDFSDNTTIPHFYNDSGIRGGPPPAQALGAILNCSIAVGERIKVEESSIGVGDFVGVEGGGIAVGFRVATFSFGALAMGWQATAAGGYSSAVGYNAMAAGYNSKAGQGYACTAVGQYSTATGPYSTSIGEGSVAAGHNCTAYGEYSEARGHYCTTGSIDPEEGIWDYSFDDADHASGFTQQFASENTVNKRGTIATHMYTRITLNAGETIFLGFSNTQDHVSSQSLAIEVFDTTGVTSQLELNTQNTPGDKWNVHGHFKNESTVATEYIFSFSPRRGWTPGLALTYDMQYRIWLSFIGDASDADVTSTEGAAGNRLTSAYFKVAEGRLAWNGIRTWKNLTSEGNYSYARGYYTQARGDFSNAEGYRTIASGGGSSATGAYTTAEGSYSTASGWYSTARGDWGAHAAGRYANAIGAVSHAEGQETYATGMASHTENYHTYSGANNSHAEGYNTATAGGYVLEILSVIAGGSGHDALVTVSSNGFRCRVGAYATFLKTGGRNQWVTAKIITVVGNAITLESTSYNIIDTDGGLYSNGDSNAGDGAHSEGINTFSGGKGAHSEGYGTRATAEGAHSEGYSTYATGDYSHAEGTFTVASAYSSHAEGNDTVASGPYSHAEGYGSKAISEWSHASGAYTTAGNPNYAYASTSMGRGTYAYGPVATATGFYSTAMGYHSFSSGMQTGAPAQSSFVGGRYSVAGDAETVFKVLAYDQATRTLTFEAGVVGVKIKVGKVVATVRELEHDGKNLSNTKIASIDVGTNTAVVDSYIAFGTNVIEDQHPTKAYLCLSNQYTGTVKSAFCFGSESITTGLGAVAFGDNVLSKNSNGMAIGEFNDAKDLTKFEVGNGTAIARSNALEVYHDGKVIAPTLSDSLIVAGGDKSLVTKEYVEAHPHVAEWTQVMSGGTVYQIDNFVAQYGEGIFMLRLTGMGGGTLSVNQVNTASSLIVNMAGDGSDHTAIEWGGGHDWVRAIKYGHATSSTIGIVIETMWKWG